MSENRAPAKRRKKTTVLCIHGRRPYACKPCGGRAYCEHGRQRQVCIPCGGKSICSHGKRRARCKECNGSEHCTHNKFRHHCIVCSKTEFCEHGKQKRSCKLCGGSSICVHNKSRYTCKECDGKGICRHKRVRTHCRVCDVKSYCSHGRKERLCVECKGAGICDHGVIRYTCRPCGGHGICSHGRIAYTCRPCGGAGVCQHDRLRHACKDCLTVEQMLRSKRWCVVCLNTALGSNRTRFGGMVCAKCDPAVLPRIEHVVRDQLAMAYLSQHGVSMPPPSIADDQHLATQKVQCATDHSRRPDLVWASADRIIHLEIDENSHGGNPVPCELAKLDESNHGVSGPHRTTLFIRFNPDVSPCGTPLSDRIARLATILQRCFSDTAVTSPALCPMRANVMYLYYGSGGEKHRSAAIQHPASIHVVEPLDHSSLIA